MLLTVLSVPDCPNVAVLLDRLPAALGDRDADLEVIVVEDEQLAAAWGMTGSPTLLVEGLDPFAAPEATPSVSCRLYRCDGAVGGAPSIEDLRSVLREPGPGYLEGRKSWPPVLDRAGRGRLAPVEFGLRAVQQAILQAISTSGHLPEEAELEQLAASHNRCHAEVLDDLAAADFVTVNSMGEVQAAYPFCLTSSRHRVQIHDGPTVWAMCALDALGVAPMLSRAVTIETADPITDQPVRAVHTPDQISADPASAVVFVGARDIQGPAEQVCCEAINFFRTRHSAARWAAMHPDTPGEILNLDQAAALSRKIFGHLLEVT